MDLNNEQIAFNDWQNTIYDPTNNSKAADLNNLKREYAWLRYVLIRGSVECKTEAMTKRLKESALASYELCKKTLSKAPVS